MDSPASPVEQTGFWRLYAKVFPHLRKPLPNPGKFEDINHESRGTHCPDFFDGLKVSLGRNFSHFNLVHNLHFKPGGEGVPMDHSYDLDLNFQTAPHSSWIFAAMTRVNKKGEVNAHLVAKPSDETSLSCQLALPGNAEQSVSVINAQVDGKSFVLTGQVRKPEQLDLSLLQSVTDKLSVGGQVNFSQQHNPLTGDMIPSNALALGARFNAEKWVGHISCTNRLYGFNAVPPEFNLSYTHRLKDLGHVSVEMQHILAHYLPRDQVSSSQKVTFGIDLKGTQSQNRFRAFVNTHGVVGSMLEMCLTPNLKVTLGLQMDHTSSEFKYVCRCVPFDNILTLICLRQGLGLEVSI